MLNKDGTIYTYVCDAFPKDNAVAEYEKALASTATKFAVIVRGQNFGVDKGRGILYKLPAGGYQILSKPKPVAPAVQPVEKAVIEELPDEIPLNAPATDDADKTPENEPVSDETPNTANDSAESEKSVVEANDGVEGEDTAETPVEDESKKVLESLAVRNKALELENERLKKSNEEIIGIILEMNARLIKVLNGD